MVDIVEPMGAETYFHLQTGAHSIISRSPAGAQHAEAGHRFKFQIGARAAHLIDAEYVVTYRPSRSLASAEKDEVRRIEIVSRRVGLNIVSRRSYVVSPAQ